MIIPTSTVLLCEIALPVMEVKWFMSLQCSHFHWHDIKTTNTKHGSGSVLACQSWMVVPAKCYLVQKYICIVMFVVV